MRIHHITLGIAVLLLTGLVSTATAGDQHRNENKAETKALPWRAELSGSFINTQSDTNHDGQITLAEAEAARAARAKANSSGKHRSASNSLFTRADANKDGIVSRAEYEAAVASGKIKSRHANMRGSAIARLFDTADVNKDGRVSLEEAQKAALQNFDSADANHDGVLTPVERRQASKAARTKRRAA